MIRGTYCITELKFWHVTFEWTFSEQIDLYCLLITHRIQQLLLTAAFHLWNPAYKILVSTFSLILIFMLRICKSGKGIIDFLKK